MMVLPPVAEISSLPDPPTSRLPLATALITVGIGVEIVAGPPQSLFGPGVTRMLKSVGPP
jgi:hypothetical protein